ncbi:hypothetical protein B0H11DRAFT_1922444 [Mycena galericulata]|nr:hypothetical protein B0H11DRAFT_1922444 [Mycena galericulata]
MSAQAIPTTIENPITLNLSGSYGVLIIAAYISCALWGINAMQGYIYYWNYPDDSWPMKMLILVTKVPWFTLVQNWGRVSAILASPQEALHEAWVGSIIVIIVQLYYLRRIAKFASTTRHARSWWLWLVIFVLVLLSVAQVPYCVFSINRANIFIPVNLRIKTAGLIAAAVVDFVIAVAMVMLLKDTDSGDGTAFKSKRTSKTIRRLTDETASGTDFWTAITQYPQCSIYLSAFLANLNARRYIRGEDDGLVISNIEDLKFATATETAAGNDAEASLHIVLGQMGSGADSSGTDGQDTANDHGSSNHEKYPNRSPV